jgi:hypothetical protein
MGSRDPLQLELGLPSSIVAGEFVVATLELTNASAGSVTVAGRRGLRGGDLWFKITDPQPGRAHAIGRFGLHGNGEAVRLAPGEQLRWGVNLSCPQFGLAFDRAGRLSVRSVYDAGSGPVESVQRVLTVLPRRPARCGTAAPADASRAGDAPVQAADSPSTAGVRTLEPYRRSTDIGALICQLALLAAALHKSRASEDAIARSAVMIEQAIARFGAETIAVLTTALFPSPGPARRALCRVFEASLGDVAGAAQARAIVRGAPFRPRCHLPPPRLRALQAMR